MLARLFGSPSSALSTTSSGDVDPWLLVPQWGGAAVLLSCVGGHWPLGGSYLLAGAADWPLACSTVCASSPGGMGRGGRAHSGFRGLTRVGSLPRLCRQFARAKAGSLEGLASVVRRGGSVRR